MECNCVKKITEELFRKYSMLWQHKCESPISVLNILYTLVGGPRLQPIESIGKSGHWHYRNVYTINLHTWQLHDFDPPALPRSPDPCSWKHLITQLLVTYVSSPLLGNWLPLSESHKWVLVCMACDNFQC